MDKAHSCVYKNQETIMSLTWKNIAVFFDQTEHGYRVLECAAQLAVENEAYLTGICAKVANEVIDYDRYARGMKAIKDVIERYSQKEHALLQQVKSEFDHTASERGINAEFRLLAADYAAQSAALNSLLCDLVVLGNPAMKGFSSEWSGENLLLKTGVPVLMIPAVWLGATIGKRIIVAWNGSREALRAVTDSLPLLLKAQAVELLMVDAKPKGTSSEPGDELSTHLTRHGVPVEVTRLSTDGLSIDRVILNEVKNFNADILVIGAYSRSRLSEIVLGGVTIRLLSQTPIPLFISH